MSISALEVEGYRSVKDVWLELRRVNVLVGPNGCGKSNLYRAMHLIAMAANGQFARALADEGGMPSVLWAGERGKGPVRLTLGVRIGNLRYKISCGLPQQPYPFPLDPDIKEESIVFTDGKVNSVLMERKYATITARDTDGKRINYPLQLSPGESMLSGLREPHRFPEVSALRQEILSWRFYHQFRTDVNSPIRWPQNGIMTPALAHDGLDLAPALMTILSIGDAQGLAEAVSSAFPGARLDVEDDRGQCILALHMPDFQRPFNAKELSDGTLHYLCLLAALMSPRLPALIALNEPETSLHPDLYESLAKLIANASQYSQLWITTHSRELADMILEHTGVAPMELEKKDGETRVVSGKVGAEY